MAEAEILSAKKEVNDFAVIAKLPNGEEVSFRAVSQEQAIQILREMDAQRTKLSVNADPVLKGKVELAVPAPLPPTPDELALTAFLELVRVYREAKAALDSGLSKTATPQSVDDAYAAMKLAYKEEYAPYVVGLF